MNFDLSAAWSRSFAGFWHPGMPYLLALVAVFAACLFHFRREYRDAVYHTLAFYALSLLVLWVSAGVAAFDLPTASAVLREAGIIGGGIAVIRLSGNRRRSGLTECNDVVEPHHDDVERRKTAGGCHPRRIERAQSGTDGLNVNRAQRAP